MTVLVLGSSGQVGQHLRSALPRATFWSRNDADLRCPDRVEKAITEFSPAFVINASAHTAVDRAESEPDVAWRVNSEGAAAIARASASLDIPLVHISTDYVFDGKLSQPYRENDRPSPLNVYGSTKLAGELAVRSICKRYWILRTSWVFSEFGSNFAKTMLRLSGERDTISIVADQRGRPSYAGDIAAIISALVIRHSRCAKIPPWGTYHTGGGPVTSWHGFAVEILQRALANGLINRMPELRPILTSAYPTPALRPINSVLEPNWAFQNALGVAPDWITGLDQTLENLASRTNVGTV